MDYIDLAEIGTPTAAPEIHEDRGVIPAPRPTWAQYAKASSHAAVTYYGPSREFAQDEETVERTVVEVRADLTAYAGPSWIEWILGNPEIHVEQHSTRYTLEGARRLAAALLELADEIENGARS